MREAIKYFELAIKNSQKAFGVGSIFEAKCYDGLGEVYFAWERYSQAVEYFKKSLILKEKFYSSMDRELVLSNYNIGRAYYKGGEAKESIRFLNDALVGGRYLYKENNPLNVKINNLLSIADGGGGGSFKIRLKDYILKYGRDSLSVANLYHDMAWQYHNSQKLEESLEFYEKSLKIYQDKLPFLHSKISNTFLDVAILYKKLEDSEQYFKNALGGFDSFYANQQAIFSTLNSVEKKSYLHSRRKFLYHLFLSSDRGKVKEVFNRWLNYKRKLYDEENTLKILYSKTDDKDVKNKIEQLFKMRQEVAKKYQESPIKNVKKLEQEILNIEAFLSLQSFNYKREMNTIDITHQDISTLLKPKELYIDFAKVQDSYYLFTLDKNQTITFKKFDKNQTKEINHYIPKIRKHAGKSSLKMTQSRYAKLYNLIIKKINIKDKTSLIISPDSLLGLIPFEAFYDENSSEYLIEKVKIRYIPSGKELVKLYQNSSKSNNDIVVFADVDFDNNRSQSQKIKGSMFETLTADNKHLEFSRQDAMTVKKLFPYVKLFLEENATEENLLKVDAPKILYLSTHGKFLGEKNSLNPMLNSVILLDGANESIRNKRGNGIVSGLELAGLNLKGTELVVLSACETGVGKIEDSEGVAGINKAFIKAGAKYIVVTLWKVDDKKSNLLIEKFYQGVKNGLSYSDALMKAKRSMIKDEKSEHPYFWSGFVGSGY